MLPWFLSMLSKLTHIEFTCGTHGTIDVDFEWGAFASLEQVSFSGRVYFAKGLGGLVVLNNLRAIHIFQRVMHPKHSTCTTKQLVKFAHQMSAERPDVEVVFADYGN